MIGKLENTREISVIIPAYNAEDCIVECLSSLTDQSILREMYEIIVVDDGSTDSTAEVSKKVGVKLIKQRNSGPAAARNRGAQEASGEVLLFIDADCVADGKWIEKMTEPFSESKIAGVQGMYKSKQKETVARFAQIEIEERYKLMKRNEYIDFIGTYAAAYRRDIFLEMGGFDTSFPIASGEDTDFSYRLSQNNHKMVLNPDAFVYHRHPGTLRSYLTQKYWRAYWRNLLYKKNKAKAVKDSYTPQTLKFQILLVLLMVLMLILFPLLKIKTFYGLVSIFLVFILTTIPFAISASKKDFQVALISPFLILLRSLTFLCGICTGFIKEILIKHLFGKHPLEKQRKE